MFFILYFLFVLFYTFIFVELKHKMFKRTFKLNQVSEFNYGTNSNAKTRKNKKVNREQINGLLSNDSIVKFCKDNIIQQNDIDNKG